MSTVTTRFREWRSAVHDLQSSHVGLDDTPEYLRLRGRVQEAELAVLGQIARSVDELAMQLEAFRWAHDTFQCDAEAIEAQARILAGIKRVVAKSARGR